METIDQAAEAVESTCFPFLRDSLFPWGAMSSYLADAWQRGILYADVMRERGNRYNAHLAEKVPNVLHFPCELILSGLDLPKPVNYGLVRILPHEAGRKKWKPTFRKIEKRRHG